MKTINTISLLVLASILAACSPADQSSSLKDQSTKTLLGLNDVSILLPYDSIPALKTEGLDSSAKPDPETFAKGQTALPLDGESFIPAWVLVAIDKELKDDIELRESEAQAVWDLETRTADQDEFLRAIDGNLSAEQPEMNPMRATNRFRLTSVRFDPCADQLLVKSLDDCTQEMRFVWTEVHERFGLRDSNIHAIYKLTRSEFQDVIHSLRQTVAESGVDTTKEPLQTQPVIRQQGLEGNYYKGILSIVHRYARNSKLKHIAFLKDTMGGLQGHWPMVKFDLDQGQAIRLPLVGVRVGEGETPKFVQRMNGDRAVLAMPSPMNNIADTIFPEFAAGTHRGDEAIIPTKVENSFRVENPLLHGVNDLDCASCHMAESERFLALDGKSAESKSAYTSATWNLAVTTKVETTGLQIFSFFINKPRIAPRAINESAEAADMIRDHF